MGDSYRVQQYLVNNSDYREALYDSFENTKRGRQISSDRLSETLEAMMNKLGIPYVGWTLDGLRVGEEGFEVIGGLHVITSAES